MVKTQCFHCRGHRFIPGQRTEIPLITGSSHQKKGKKERKDEISPEWTFFFSFLDSKTLELKFRIPRLSFVAKFDVFLLHPVA